MSRHFLILLIVVLTVTAVTGGLYEQRRAQRLRALTQRLANKQAQDGELVAQAFRQSLNLLDENYVTALERERVTHGAITGMLHALDPHSNFFDWREFNEMRNEQNSKFDGIGVTINQRNGRLYVLGVIPGMPAAKAGLRYGDALVSVNGLPAQDWTQTDALKHVRGKAGTTVQLAIERAIEPAPLTLEVERAEVPYPSVRNRFIVKPDIGYIALTGGFNQTTSDELRDALDALKKDQMRSLILDLRRNPGGILREAIQVAEIFLPRDTEIVSVKDARNRRIHRSDNAAPENLPLVVLIDNESASASEIVAGAIQDQDRGWIVGVPSFGKGLVQTVFPLPAGTGLTLTTAKYFTASGRSIQREYTGLSFYDYYAERRGGLNGKTAPTPTGQAFYTPTRRALQSGGGITPDKLVSLPEPDYRLRDACFEFARRIVAGVYPPFAAYQVGKASAEPRDQELPVTDEMLTAFRDFLRTSATWRSYETRILSQTEAVRRRLRAEILTAHYGVEVGERSLLESDPQVLAAIAELPQARSLLERARLPLSNATGATATQH
jgi:carboxyl-terminal processing protease